MSTRVKPAHITPEEKAGLRGITVEHELRLMELDQESESPCPEAGCSKDRRCLRCETRNALIDDEDREWERQHQEEIYDYPEADVKHEEIYDYDQTAASEEACRDAEFERDPGARSDNALFYDLVEEIEVDDQRAEELRRRGVYVAMLTGLVDPEALQNMDLEELERRANGIMADQAWFHEPTEPYEF